MGISNRGMAKWLEDFVQNINKVTASEDKQPEKLAEINIDDLDKVVWNDETFYVMFDDKGATILNEFGNTVTTLQNVNTIQEVDDCLNSKQVVANDEADPFEEELKKVSTYLNDDITTDEIEPEPETETITAENEQTLNNEQQNNEFAPSTVDEFAPTNQPIPSTDDTSTQIDNIENDINNVAKSLDVNEKLASLEDMIARLTEQVQTLVQSQEYAHTDPGSVYDTGSDALEMQHIQDAIEKGQQLLDIEHSTDLTTMDGRVSFKDKLHDIIDNVISDDSVNLTDDVFVEDTDSVEDTGLMEIDPFENPVEEVPTDETNIVIDPEIASEELSTEQPVVITVDETDNQTPESLEDQTSQEPEIDQNESLQSDKFKTDTNYDELEGDTPKMTTPQNGGPVQPKGASDNRGIVKLNSKDSKIFTKQICPECGEQSLVKSKTASCMVGIYCKDCNTEYAVDTNTEEIYKNNI